MTVEQKCINNIVDIVKSNDVISHVDLYQLYCCLYPDGEYTDIWYRNFIDFVNTACRDGMIQRDIDRLAYMNT